ncbi:MAG: hypothetical protein ACLS43_07950 [Evtepia gabavorous]
MSVDYVIQHAAPTLAGIKTGNLFLLLLLSQAMVRDLRAINQVLVPGDPAAPLRRDNTRVLLYLFARRRSPDYPGRPAGSSGRRAIRTWPNTPASELKRRLQAGEPFS